MTLRLLSGLGLWYGFRVQGLWCCGAQCRGTGGRCHPAKGCQGVTSAATTFRVALQLWRHANDRVRVALLRKASCTGEKGGGRSPCLHGCGKTVTTQKLCLGATATAARMVLHGLQQSCWHDQRWWEDKLWDRDKTMSRCG